MSTTVSVIGCGALGSALCRSFLRGGHEVTVWNRTASKTEPLVAAGAKHASSAASAIASSGATIICIDDYEVTQILLDTPDIIPALQNRTILQVSTGSPEDARKMGGWVECKGAEYLDCAVMAYPEQIDRSEGMVLVAGNEAVFRKHEALLKTLTEDIRYVGADPGAACATDFAVLSHLFAALLGAVHGARICELENVSVHAFGDMLAELAPVIGTEVKRLSRAISEGNFDETQAALKTHAAAAERIVVHASDAGINAEIPKFVAKVFKKGMDAGFGAHDAASLIKVLRNEA